MEFDIDYTSPEMIEKYFKEKYNFKLNLHPTHSEDTVIEFENEAEYVLFILEWS